MSREGDAAEARRRAEAHKRARASQVGHWRDRAESTCAAARAWAAYVESKSPSLNGQRRAAVLGISGGFWSKIRNGRVPPPEEVQADALIVWGVPVLEFFDEAVDYPVLVEALAGLAVELGLEPERSTSPKACLSYVEEAFKHLRRELRETQPQALEPRKIREAVRRAGSKEPVA